VLISKTSVKLGDNLFCTFNVSFAEFNYMWLLTDGTRPGGNLTWTSCISLHLCQTLKQRHQSLTPLYTLICQFQ